MVQNEVTGEELSSEEMLRLKVRLLTEGATLPKGHVTGRKGGAGPTGARYFILPNGRSCGIPIRKQHASHADFALPKVRKMAEWPATRALQQSQRLERVVSGLADHDVVVDRDAELGGGRLNLPGHLDVGLGGRRVAGGVVVHQY